MLQEADENYRTDECGFIANPGKFEGEPPWIPLLWDRVTSGNSDRSVHDGSMAIDGFELTESMAALTGLTAEPGKFICLWSNDDGFVSHMLMTGDELDNCEGFDVGVGDYDIGGESSEY